MTLIYGPIINLQMMLSCSHFLMRSDLFESTLILIIALLAQGHELFKKNHAAAEYRAKDYREKHASQPFLNNDLTWSNLIYLEVCVFFWNPYDVMLFWFCSQCFSISCGAGLPCSDFLVIFCRLWLPPRFWLRSTQELLRYHTPFVTLHSLLFCNTLFLTYTKIFQIVHVFRAIRLRHNPFVTLHPLLQ